MASDQTDANLTSYLKSMFIQYNGEDTTPPPPVPATRNSKASLSEEVSAFQQIDMNNNEDGHSSPPSPNLSPPSSKANGSSIQVDVIVHNDATNSVTNSELNGHKDIEYHEEEHPLVSEQHQEEPVVERPHEQPIGNGNRIALSFLDELKHTLQANKPLESEDAPIEPDHKELQAESSPVVVSSDQPNESEEVKFTANEKQVPATVPEPTAPLEPSTNSFVSEEQQQHQEEESLPTKDEEVESGISVDDHSSIASDSNATLTNGYATRSPPEPSSPNQPPLSRSSSTSDIVNGNAGNNRRVTMRSVSQDVKFKLEAIKEEKKVTKTRVSSLANFWKDKMIKEKDQN